MRESTYLINGVTLGADPYVVTEAPKGFPSGAPIRTGSTPKPHQTGAYGDKGWAGPKQLELSGRIYASGPDWTQANARRDALIAAAWVDTPTVMVITGNGIARQMTVRSVGNTPVEVVEGNSYTDVQWRAQWEALDPRLYSTTAHSSVVGLPVASGGVGFPMAAPISFGGSAGGGSLIANNAGSAPAPWTARLDGPLVGPSITSDTAGLTLLINGTINAGEFMLVDSLARTILLGGTASRYSLLARPNWWDLRPGNNTVRFNATSGSGTMTFSWRDAWW